MSGQVTSRKLTGRHVAFMLAGFFGLMFAVNGVFVYFALNSFSGVSVSDAYRRGLAYNQELQAKEKQNARGWQHMLEFVQLDDKNGIIRLKLLDLDKQPMANLTVSGTLGRPVIEESDKTVTFVFAEQFYTADLVDLEKGQWDVTIQILGGGYTEPYRLDKRIWVD
ncbi:FixH family protein [Sneathiella marina]|uniref:FixH family protein n=1 Tax=Sneathiella marina TaxID=2950108 RepID=A0ABY4W0N4_9PROT|nr:FixH family protein [Sneathiella marina]USG60419.1 FixH family protein [Sneathiella marina]